MEYAAYFHGQLFASHTQCLEGLKCNFYNNSLQFKRNIVESDLYDIHYSLSIHFQVCFNTDNQQSIQPRKYFKRGFHVRDFTRNSFYIKICNTSRRTSIYSLCERKRGCLEAVSRRCHKRENCG